MKNFRRVTVEAQELESITCDDCRTTYAEHNFLEVQEFLHVRFNAGYGSIFGDLNIVEADLCQHCVKRRLGDVLRVTGQYLGNLTPEDLERGFLERAAEGEEQGCVTRVAKGGDS